MYSSIIGYLFWGSRAFVRQASPEGNAFSAKIGKRKQ
jgi:hypothetical protein